MKVYSAMTAGHRIQTATLDRRGVRRRLISYVDTPQFKKAEAKRNRAQAKGHAQSTSETFRDGYEKIDWRNNAN